MIGMMGMIFAAKHKIKIFPYNIMKNVFIPAIAHHAYHAHHVLNCCEYPGYPKYPVHPVNAAKNPVYLVGGCV